MEDRGNRYNVEITDMSTGERWLITKKMYFMGMLHGRDNMFEIDGIHILGSDLYTRYL